VRFTGGGRAAQQLMEYCWETVDECVPPAEILERLRSEGFAEIHTERYAMMIEYRARRAQEACFAGKRGTPGVQNGPHQPK
jgi:hypothetical protein